ncbi:uncharacterized protein LOC123513273 [Portunus trituberculatus]|uniref:uncharacterized protein LOC123513273 n=1 Tax=Portunus trituberculatus TaxID=210409 RepID=UPI001E1CC461|nr:uncharacterized protein LOC123513273 [Portunus trituberculatus]
MLAKGAIELVGGELEGLYVRLFLVPKVTGGLRPVFDLSTLNKFLVVSPFRMETVASVLESMNVEDWMVSLDMRDAYFQVFTKVMAPVSSWVYRHDISLHHYLDDWLVTGTTLQGCIGTIRAVLRLCAQLGIQISLPISDVVPSQRKQYRGMVLDSVRALVFSVTRKGQPVSLSGEKFSRGHSHYGVSMEVTPGSSDIPGEAGWSQAAGMLSVPSVMSEKTLEAALDAPWWRIPPSQRCLADLSWWIDLGHILKGALFVMASPEQSQFGVLISCLGVWSPQEQRFHINHLEMMAVFWALQSF